jgi:NAD+ synthase
MTLKDEADKVAFWIAEYIQEKAGAQGAVVGLSGGVDSSVTAALCINGLGSSRVLGVILPCDSPITDVLDATQVAEYLKIDAPIIDLERTYRQWYDDYRDTILPLVSESRMPEIDRLVKGNFKSRLRMATLYALAGQNNYLVVGTTNKSEMMVGYCTKYGDGGVDIEPIAQFYKTEVWEMAELLEIPCDIIDRVPTAGLWDGQTDEQELGMNYQELDYILQAPEPELPAKIRNMLKTNKHKDLHLPCYNRDSKDRQHVLEDQDEDSPSNSRCPE